MKRFNVVYREEAGDQGQDLAGDQGQAEAPRWYYQSPIENERDGVGGNGEVPEWMMVDKYKSVEEQAKGYKELSSRFGGFDGSPEEYAMPEGFSDAGLDEGMLSIVREIGLENKMSQNMFNDLVSKVATYQLDQQEELTKNAMTKLGEKAEERISTVQNWLNTNAPKEMIEKIAPLATSAEAIEALEFFIDKSKGSTLAPHNTTPIAKMSQSEYADKLMAKDANGNLKISVDPEYKKEIDKLTESRMRG